MLFDVDGVLLHFLYKKYRFIEGLNLPFYQVVNGDLDVSSTREGQKAQ